MKEENLCVLIDFENIAAGTEKAKLGRFNIRLVMNRLKEKGRILVTRAYGDWHAGTEATRINGNANHPPSIRFKAKHQYQHSNCAYKGTSQSTE